MDWGVKMRVFFSGRKGFRSNLHANSEPFRSISANRQFLYGVMAIVAFCSYILVPTSASADEILTPQASCDQCYAPPKQVGPFTFEDAKNAFAKGVLPTPEDLVGRWVNVGFADPINNSYRPEGYTWYGRYVRQLDFAETTLFSGATQINMKYIELQQDLNTGNLFDSWVSMVPTLSSDKICFSFTTTYNLYQWQCRVLADDRRKMVCNIHLSAISLPYRVVEYFWAFAKL